MTRLQKERSRKLHSIGCSSEYDNKSGILQISLDNHPICRLHSDDNYTYRSGDHQSDEQSEAFLKVENMINSAKEYISAYEKAPQFEIDGIKDYRKLSEFNGVAFAKEMNDSLFYEQAKAVRTSKRHIYFTVLQLTLFVYPYII